MKILVPSPEWVTTTAGTMQRHTILFLAASPITTDLHRLASEAREIQAELDRGTYRGRFQFVTRWASRPHDLLREMRKVAPAVVHFAGYGDPDGGAGLFFEGLDGHAQLVSTQTITETFGAMSHTVELVVLNACYSEPQATELLAHVNNVVGMRGSFDAHAARAFAIGFYGGLAERESVASAFAQGCAAISLTNLPEADRPQLKSRAGTDPARLILAAARLDPDELLGMAARTIEDDDRAIDLELVDRGGIRQESHAEAVLSLSRLVVVGPAGAGKTAWLRRLHRHLWKHGATLPVVIDRHAVGPRTHDSLAVAMARTLDIDPARLHLALEDNDGPRPILLLDGWDEIEAVDPRLRRKLLGLCADYPQLGVVVAARRVFGTCPGEADGFTVRHVAPLDDGQIARLVQLHAGADSRTFLAQLAGAHPAAMDLARNPQLLVMMLATREQGIPVLHHEVFARYIERVICTRERGASCHARLAAVAALAARRLQYLDENARNPRELARLMSTSLPTLDEREALVLELLGAGVLREVPDGIAFAHVRLHEYLAARHLAEQPEAWGGLEPTDRSWREPLAIYLAIAAERDPRRGRELVADALVRGAFEVAGIALAYGECDSAAWKSWLDAIVRGDKDDALHHHIFDVWRTASSTPRRIELVAGLGAWTAQEPWPTNGVRSEWVAGAFGGRRWHPLDALTEATWTPPELVEHARSALPTSKFEQLLDWDTFHAAGRTRALTGMSAWWPDAGVTALIRAWGGRRGAIANSAQTLISLGGNEHDIRHHVHRLVNLAPERCGAESELEERLIEAFMRPCPKLRGTQGFALEWARWRAREWVRYWRTVAVDIEPAVATAWIERYATEWAHQWYRKAPHGQSPEDWCAGLGEFVEMTRRPDVAVEVASIGHRATARIALASYRSANHASAFELVQEGCRRTLGAHDELAARLESWDGDDFWPAFTKQLVRRYVPSFETATEAADRALLEAAIAEPEQCDTPLASAITFYMRGDLVFEDDRLLSLDAICDDAGLSRISIFEDLFA